MKEYHYCIYKENYESKPEVKSIHDIPSTGFISTYFYTKDLLEFFVKNKGVKGLTKAGLPCWSPVLFLDFDDCYEDAMEFYKLLVDNNISHSAYHSGGRSVHFHVARKSPPSFFLPHSDSEFISRVAPKADRCLYQHGRVFRLPGTLHHLTGEPKRLLKTEEGREIYKVGVEPLIIDITEPDNREVVSVVSSSVSLFEDSFVLSCLMGASKGHRNKTMFMLAKNLCDKGLSSSFIIEFLNQVNLVNNPPLSKDEMESLVRSHVL
jgi:hypothetical protein